MLIRKATIEDARGIATVHVRGWQIGYRDLMPAEYLATFAIGPREVRWREQTLVDPALTILVADDADVILGFAGFGVNGDELGEAVGELTGLYVDPDRWGEGIGSKLIEDAEAGLAATYASAILWTLDANTRTRRFYEHHGWQTDGATKPHRAGPMLVRYRKDLKETQ